MVIVKGEPDVEGDGQETTPVLELIVTPAGAPAPNDHVIGVVPALVEGVPEVKLTPQDAVAFVIGSTVGATHRLIRMKYTSCSPLKVAA